jgi:lipopolysaccharide export system protein LptC
VSSVQSPAFDADLETRFARAARHSRLVRILRIAVPAAVILSMAGIVYEAVFNEWREPLKLPSIDPGKMAGISGTKITMESPHLAGYTPDRRPYEVWAKTAIQDITAPDHLEHSTLRGKLLMADQSTISMDALTGNFDNKKQLLDLQKDIILRTSTGYEARLSQALVDMGKGTITSDEQVNVKMTSGTLSSDRLRITEGGAVIRFEGNVVMHLDNMGNAAPTSAPQASDEAEQPAKLRGVQGRSENSR